MHLRFKPGAPQAPMAHSFQVIRWLGERRERKRFGVVEVDDRGPILRAGPFASEGQAWRVVGQLAQSSDQQWRKP